MADVHKGIRLLYCLRNSKSSKGAKRWQYPLPDLGITRLKTLIMSHDQEFCVFNVFEGGDWWASYVFLLVVFLSLSRCLIYVTISN